MQSKIIASLADIDPLVWRLFESPHYPFNDYAFLMALEQTACIGVASGWQLAYLALEDEEGLAAVHPAYVKGHSYGEYIFDWDWARFYAQNQVAYYPKLLSALPFTPATGPRLLQRHSGNELRETLIGTALELARRSSISSYHALFLDEDEAALFSSQGLMLRHSLQYHWHNAGYRDFADYLDSLIGKRRRDIQRERRRASEQGLTIRRLTGPDLTPELAQGMEELYHATIGKKEAIAYLKPGFFREVFARMPERILLVAAQEGATLVAGALNFFKGEKLYGRYWGALRPYPDLHFELCYYQTIDFAIERRLRVFEAGAQGEHKIQRGFLPAITLSAHEIFDPRFRPAIADYIEAEKRRLREAIVGLGSQNPFRGGATSLATVSI